MTFYGDVKHTPANWIYCVQHPHPQFRKYLLHQRCFSARKQNGVRDVKLVRSTYRARWWYKIYK